MRQTEHDKGKVPRCELPNARQKPYFKKVSSQSEKLYPWIKVRDGRNEDGLQQQERGRKGRGIGLHNGIVSYNDKREE